MAEHTEEALAARLVETYSDRLLRLAYSILNSVPDAQDVCQEVLLKRLEYPGAFENEKHEQAWMVRVTVNACRDLLKSFFRSRTVSLDALPELPAAMPPDHREVLESLAHPHCGPGCRGRACGVSAGGGRRAGRGAASACQVPGGAGALLLFRI